MTAHYNPYPSLNPCEKNMQPLTFKTLTLIPAPTQEFSNLLAHLERDEKLPEDAKALAILREDVASLLFEMKKLMRAYEEVFAPKETTES